jgi:hypothetical protein
VGSGFSRTCGPTSGAFLAEAGSIGGHPVMLIALALLLAMQAGNGFLEIVRSRLLP